MNQLKTYLAIVIPTYGAFDYVNTTVNSALKHTVTPDGRLPLIIVVDDDSPELRGKNIAEVGVNVDPGQAASVKQIQLVKNVGYIAAVNVGLQHAFRAGATYTCVANSDLIFTRGWNLPLEKALFKGFALVGPLTNAPGSAPWQSVQRYVPNYRLTDDEVYLNGVADDLTVRYKGSVTERAINGFCLFAFTTCWQIGAYDSEHVFRPSNPVNSRGQRVAQPHMELSEYELQGRWHKAGRRSGYCLDSFVFHYKAVSRGKHHVKGAWFRRERS